ncbi:MAG: FecR domain-containing protein [Anaerolineae bacterium]|nr:FecR domain-containing protein [Anaerolineae bacterium]
MRRLLIIGMIGLLLLATGIAVLAKPETAVATLIVSEGQATVTQNRTRFGVWPLVTAVTLSAGNVATISQGDVISQDSGVGQLRLYDGSTVDLIAGTQLAITELSITPTEYRVQLQLLAGQTVNRVVKLLGANDYFRVSTPSSTAAVRGTLFTVEVLSETATLVSVDEGIVRVTLGTAFVDVNGGQMVTAVVGQPLQVQPQPTTALPADQTLPEQPAAPTATSLARPQPTTPPTVTPTPSDTPVPPSVTPSAPLLSAATPTLAVTAGIISPTPVIMNNLPTATLPAAVLPTVTLPGLPTTIPPTTAPPVATNTPVIAPTNSPAPSPTAAIAPTATTAATATPQPLPTATLLPTATPSPEPPTATPELVTLCHVSPGNPDQNQTLQVLPDAAAAHLAHGDYLGPCQ